MSFCTLIEGASKMGGYKFFWMGCEKGIHGVGLQAADIWIKKVFDIKYWIERIMVMRVIVGRSVLDMVSVEK